MQIKSQSAPARADTSAHDAARYGDRLAEIADHLATFPGEDSAKARALLSQAADSAHEASRLIGNVKSQKLRLHVNIANQPSLLTEAVRYLLQINRGDAPAMLHSGPSQENLPYPISITARLVTQLRALLGHDAVWTEVRK